MEREYEERKHEEREENGICDHWCSTCKRGEYSVPSHFFYVYFLLCFSLHLFLVFPITESSQSDLVDLPVPRCRYRSLTLPSFCIPPSPTPIFDIHLASHISGLLSI